MTIDSVGYSGSIGWAQWAEMASKLGTDYGVVGESDFQVSIYNGPAGEVRVKPGLAHGQGVVDAMDVETLVGGLDSPNTWYTIALRRDWTAGPGNEETSLIAIPGGASQAISGARLTGSGVVDDQPIALVFRSGITLTTIVDLRCWWGNGGLIAATSDALAYLGRPGSVAWVGNIPWRRVLGGAWLQRIQHEGIAPLPASKVDSGVFDLARIPSLPASQIGSGVIPIARGGTGASTAGAARNALQAAGLYGDPAVTFNASYLTAVNAVFANTVAPRTGTGVRIQQNLNVDLLTKTGTLQVSDIGTTSSSANVYCSAPGNFWKTSSSRRYKRDIRDADAMSTVLDVRPRTWLSKTRPDDEKAGTRHFGAVAEEVAELGLESLITRNDKGQPESVNYDRIAIALIPEVRAMRDMIDALEGRVAKLEAAK